MKHLIPFPGAYWFAAAAILGLVRWFANLTNTDGWFLLVFLLMVVGFYRLITRMPIDGDPRPYDHPGTTADFIQRQMPADQKADDQ